MQPGTKLTHLQLSSVLFILVCIPCTFLVSETNVGGAFTINNNTGVITINGALDREAKASYLVRVGVSLNQPKPTHCTKTRNFFEFSKTVNLWRI